MSVDSRCNSNEASYLIQVQIVWHHTSTSAGDVLGSRRSYLQLKVHTLNFLQHILTDIRHFQLEWVRVYHCDTLGKVCHAILACRGPRHVIRLQLRVLVQVEASLHECEHSRAKEPESKTELEVRIRNRGNSIPTPESLACDAGRQVRGYSSPERSDLLELLSLNSTWPEVTRRLGLANYPSS